jgi:hypothetical protein
VGGQFGLLCPAESPGGQQPVQRGLRGVVEASAAAVTLLEYPMGLMVGVR